jgi:hypothetical protein
MKKIILPKKILAVLFIAMIANVYPQTNYTKYVDPIIGTDAHGHTYPGANILTEWYSLVPIPILKVGTVFGLSLLG